MSDHRPASPATPTLAHHRVQALDGLRGLAVVAVIAFHAGLLPGGYLGVDLFFVLSGYLITGLLLAEHARRGTIDLAAFWTRRARRLLPALVLVVGVAALAMLVASAADRAAFGADATAALLYVANWRAALGGGGYWAQYSTPSLLEHTWSLAIEEQFYLVWPLVTIAVLGGRRRAERGGVPRDGARRLLVVALAGAAASSALLIGWSFAGGERDRLYLGTDTRAAGVLLGAALACVAARRPASSPAPHHRVVVAAGWLGAAWLAAAWWRLDGDAALLYRGGLLMSGLAATAVIASVTTVERGGLARLLAWRPLVAAGVVSYGLYLWHWPIFVWFDEARVGWSGPPLLALQLALTIAAAVASYRFVELPVRQGAFAARPALAAAGALVAVGSLVAFVVVVPDPDPGGRTASASISTLGPFPAAPGSGTVVTPADPPRVLIAGDSVGATVADGVLPHQAEFGIEARSVAVAGCGVARDNPQVRDGSGREIDETNCLGTTSTWASEVEAWRPDAVLIVLGWPGQTERFVEGEWRRPCDPVFDRWYADEVAAAIDATGRTESHVAIATAPYYRPPSAAVDSDASTDCLNRTYREVATARPSVAVIDLADQICPGGACAVERDGVVLRPDGLHFTGPSSVWIADRLLHDQWRAAAGVVSTPS